MYILIKWPQVFQRSLNPYRIDFGYPPHKNTAERIRTLIFQLRKDRLRGEIPHFYLGVLTHFIADKWCYSSDKGNLHQEFEKRLDRVKIDPGWAHVDIMDASILDTIQLPISSSWARASRIRGHDGSLPRVSYHGKINNRRCLSTQRILELLYRIKGIR